MEYITKQQAIDLVKRCEVIIGCTGVVVLTREIERMNEGIVRCKFCVKRKTDSCSMHYESDCEEYSWEVDDDFCSCGKRG